MGALSANSMSQQGIEAPYSVKENGERLHIVFSVAYVKQNSLKIEQDDNNLTVRFSTFDSKRYHRTLPLAHPVIEEKTSSDIQSKTLTVSLVKVDGSIEWGPDALGKGAKKKGKNKKTGARSDEQLSPAPSPVQKPSASPPLCPADAPEEVAKAVPEELPEELQEDLPEDLPDGLLESPRVEEPERTKNVSCEPVDSGDIDQS